MAAERGAGSNVCDPSRWCMNPARRMSCQHQSSLTCPRRRPLYGYECCREVGWGAAAGMAAGGTAGAAGRVAAAAGRVAGSNVCAPSRWCMSPARRTHCPRPILQQWLRRRPPYVYERCKGEGLVEAGAREVAGIAAAAARAAEAAATEAGSSVCAPSRRCAYPGRRNRPPHGCECCKEAGLEAAEVREVAEAAAVVGRVEVAADVGKASNVLAPSRGCPTPGRRIHKMNCQCPASCPRRRR